MQEDFLLLQPHTLSLNHWQSFVEIFGDFIAFSRVKSSRAINHFITENFCVVTSLQCCVVVDVPENYHKCPAIVVFGDLIASDTFSFRWHVVRHVVCRLECFGLTSDGLIFCPSSCLKRWQKFNKNIPCVMPDCESEKDASGWPKGIFNFLSLSTYRRRKMKQIHLRRRIVIEIYGKGRNMIKCVGVVDRGSVTDFCVQIIYEISILRHQKSVLPKHSINSTPNSANFFSTVTKLSQAGLKLSRAFRFHLPL